MYFKLAFATISLLASTNARAQAGTSVYAEVLGPTGTYALGIEHTIFRVDRTQIVGRAGASYSIESNLLPGNPYPHVLAIPVAAFIRVPVGVIGRVPLSVEAEGGTTLARPYGAVTRFFLSEGQTFAFFPHAMASVRTDLLGERLFVRAGVTMGGVGRRGSFAPAASIGVGL